MSRANTLRNSTLIFLFTQDGFVKGNLEVNHTDVTATILGDEWLFEAKSTKNVEGKITSDIQEAVAQLEQRIRSSQKGGVVTNRYTVLGDVELEEYVITKLPANWRESLSKAYEDKKAKFSIKVVETIDECYALLIPGHTDEQIRWKLSQYIQGWILKERSKEVSLQSISKLVDVMNSLLDTLADDKQKDVDFENVEMWFKMKLRPNDSLSYDMTTKKYFATEQEFDEAFREYTSLAFLHNSKSIYGALLIKTDDELREFVQGNVELKGVITYMYLIGMKGR